jgi:hypothetical protein
MKLAIFTLLLALILPSAEGWADDGDQAFLLCHGVSQKDSTVGFSFTVTLHIPNEKVINIGSGVGAVTETFTDSEIGGTQNLGGGVVNRLTIDRLSRTFRLEILRGKATASGGNGVPDDEFAGMCSPTSKAFCGSASRACRGDPLYV